MAMNALYISGAEGRLARLKNDQSKNKEMMEDLKTYLSQTGDQPEIPTTIQPAIQRAIYLYSNIAVKLNEAEEKLQNVRQFFEDNKKDNQCWIVLISPFSLVSVLIKSPY